jgi:PleD family two-component response regulator
MLRYNKTDLAGLTNDADAALYEAKDAGRDRIAVCGSAADGT